MLKKAKIAKNVQTRQTPNYVHEKYDNFLFPVWYLFHKVTDK